MLHSVPRFPPVQSHWGGDDAVPDIGRPGRESPVLFHAARLLAQDIHVQAVAVTAEHLPPVE